MNKIDEIALRVASEIGAVSYSPPPFRAVRGYSFTYDDLWRFTRALVADPELLAELRKATSSVIASEQNPVGEGYIRDGKIIAVKLKDVELVMRLPEGVTLESLYLHPAPIPEVKDAFPQAHRLALELECLILSCKDTVAVSKWWDSANEALEQWREFNEAARSE